MLQEFFARRSRACLRPAVESDSQLLICRAAATAATNMQAGHPLPQRHGHGWSWSEYHRKRVYLGLFALYVCCTAHVHQQHPASNQINVTPVAGLHYLPKQVVQACTQPMHSHPGVICASCPPEEPSHTFNGLTRATTRAL
jgi:hypothetical protein